MIYILHKVEPNEDIESIARMYNIAPCVLPKDVSVGNTLKIAVSGGRGKAVYKMLDYIIKPAETLESIAKRFDVPFDKIIRDNNEIHPYVGERVKIIK